MRQGKTAESRHLATTSPSGARIELLASFPEIDRRVALGEMVVETSESREGLCGLQTAKIRLLRPPAHLNASLTEQADGAGDAGSATCGREAVLGPCVAEERLLCRFQIQNRQPNLLEIVGTLAAPRRLAGRLNCR